MRARRCFWELKFDHFAVKIVHATLAELRNTLEWTHILKIDLAYPRSYRGLVLMHPTEPSLRLGLLLSSIVRFIENLMVVIELTSGDNPNDRPSVSLYNRVNFIDQCMRM